MKKNESDFKSENNFTPNELAILEKNKNFFSTNKKYVESMLKIINRDSDISIRILDWFVANYSKKNNTFYRIIINGRNSLFYVNNEYKNQLKGYSKHYFDPFCRKKKVIYTYKENKEVIRFNSSIGQLNFFQWAIRNKIIVYVQKHINEIRNDMIKTFKLAKKKKLEAEKEAEKAELEVSEPEVYTKPDPVICSSDKVNSVQISSTIKKTLMNKNSGKVKRQQLSKSVYDFGIKNSNISTVLDFD